MPDLIFATNNQNKVIEVKNALDSKYTVYCLSDLGINMEIAEPYDTLEENALEKARVIQRLTGKDCFSEDTGLFTEALNGRPGVKSARYAGNDCDSSRNIIKLINKLKDNPHRSATFRTIICLLRNGTHIIFEGKCKGTIIADTRGSFGFGYDPVFIPDGSNKTFAEMQITEKNLYSHRRKAIDGLTDFLNSEDTH
ncbi:MAG: RdgB/HAM1 family non-canonical purine NTP pyrophosphatase [Ginsengibacter sp.]